MRGGFWVLLMFVFFAGVFVFVFVFVFLILPPVTGFLFVDFVLYSAIDNTVDKSRIHISYGQAWTP